MFNDVNGRLTGVGYIQSQTSLGEYVGFTFSLPIESDGIHNISGISVTGDWLSTAPNAVPVPSTLVMSSILFAMFGIVWAYRRVTATTAAI